MRGSGMYLYSSIVVFSPAKLDSNSLQELICKDD